jgi:hypothetical protein
VWHPESVASRKALGRALYRVPGALRDRLPRAARDAVRHRIGPFAPWESGFTHAPPPTADGERTGPPDFVGIGAQKAGTTWWFGSIVAHPGVFHRTSIHKERHFFARFATEPFGPAQVGAYHAWFPRPAGTITGEWTPDYLCQPWVAPLLRRAAPDARLLVMVRDPIERLVSGLAHGRRLPGSHGGAAVVEAVDRGFYAASLHPWAASLESGQLLVLQYEQCVADPVAQLARTYRFLGLDDSFRPPDLGRPENPTRRPKATIDADARRRLVDVYRADVAELARLVPELDLGLWPDFEPR